jgi:DNA-binding transcriptional ArsR family regulator
MIRFRVPADALDLLEVTYSPLLEAILSLHVLAAPRHHALQHPWVRAMRHLSAPLRRELSAFSFAFRGFVPDFGYTEASAGFASFETELRRTLATSPTTIAFAFLRPVYDHGGRHDRRLLRDDAVRRQALRQARALGGDARVAALVFDDPRELARRFGELLRGYWREAFADEWERLEPKLARTVTEAGRRLAGGDAYALLADLAPRLRVDRAAEELTLDLPHEHTVEIRERRTLTLIPSAYAWPHVLVNCDQPWPLSIVYPAPFVVRDAAPRIPDADLLRLLRALGDDTRLRALRLIAERPRSTQELAPLVGISEAGLSKHLRQLADAGVLRTSREGYYVLYELTETRLAALTDDLVAFLGRRTPR